MAEFTRNKPMTAKQLIDALSKFNPSQNVVIQGYEGGFHDVKAAVHISLVRNYYSDETDYYGPHEKLESADPSGGIPFYDQCLFLTRFEEGE